MVGRRLDRLELASRCGTPYPLHPRVLSSTQIPGHALVLRCLPRCAGFIARHRIHAPTLECSRRRNLLVDVNGGPNHLKNLCDANMIQDVAGEKGDQPLIKQASRYYRKISSMSPGITAPRVEQASYY